MKVLITGRAIPAQPDRCTGQQLARGFQEAGHDALFYGCFYGEPYRFLGAKEAQGEDFDLVIVTEMNDGMPGYEPLFNYFRLKDVPRIYWDFDISYHPELSLRRATSINYDGYLVGNDRFLGDKGFGRLGKPVMHLPYACSPSIHRRKPEIERDHLVGFIGSMTSERESLFGHSEIRATNGVFGEALIDATNRMHAMIHVNQDACAGLVPGRPWETTGCGTALFMDKKSYDDFTAIVPPFVANSAVQAFNSQEELHQLIDTYRQSDKLEELNRDSLQLMKYMHENESYRNRAESIVEWIKQQKLIG